ncbi:MAG: NUDIX hydrolase [Desulfomonilaceae bacterium]
MSPSIDDPRLIVPECSNLKPVKTVHENPWFSVRYRGGFYSVEYKEPQVAILPVVDGQKVVMVRVRRPLISDAPLELPAGGVVREESPAEAARRELTEETGIAITNLDRFKECRPVCATPRIPCLIHTFQIELSASEYDARGEHDDEVTRVELLSISEVANKMVLGEIYLCLPLALLARFMLETDQKLVKSVP